MESGRDVQRRVSQPVGRRRIGSQYTVNRRCRLRMGYAYGQNPIDPNTGSSLAGVSPPGGVPIIKYLQAQLGS